jgi:hypothetical protein
MLKSRKFFFAICLLLATLSKAQKDNTLQLWLDYKHFNRINGNWQFFNDAGYRYTPKTDHSGYWRVHVRPSIEYRKQVLFSLRAGLGLFVQDNFNAINTFEIRPWQGARLHWPNIDRVRIVQYARLEQRFQIPFSQNIESSFTLKLRYKIDTKIPINNPTIVEKTYYVKASVEFFADLAIVESATSVDRNRIELGAGYLPVRDIDVRLIYTYQNNRNNLEGGIIQNDHVIRISVIQRFGMRER